MSLVSLEDLCKKYEVLDNIGMLSDVDKSIKNFLTELLALRAENAALKWRLDHSFKTEDSYDEGTLTSWYISSVSSLEDPVWTEEHIEEVINDFYLFPKENFKEYTDPDDYYSDIEYWSNTSGEIAPADDTIPDEIKVACDFLRDSTEVWDGTYGSLCCLVKYKNEYGVLMTNEFDEETAKNNNCSMDELYDKMLKKAKNISNCSEIYTANAKVLTTKTIGVMKCHEISVFLPLKDTPPAIIHETAEFLDKTIYDL